MAQKIKFEDLPKETQQKILSGTIRRILQRFYDNPNVPDEQLEKYLGVSRRTILEHCPWLADEVNMNNGAVRRYV